MPVTVDTDFPGGNAVIEDIDGDAVALRPDLRDTEGDWFYWCVRVRGAAGRILRLRLGAPNTLTVRGPMLSRDGGATWTWLGEGPDWTADCPVPADADELLLGMAPPYTGVHLEAFLARWRGHPRLRERELCRSPEDAPVPLLDIAPTDTEEHQVLVTARHHCCEMQADREIEGLVAATLADDELGAWFAARCRLLVVPFVDRDGVERGDQGKNRRPHDHGRDYGHGRYPETRAIRELVANGCDERLGICLDLHCPWIRRQYNEFIYQVGAQEEEHWRRQRAFGRLLESVRRGPLPYRRGDDLPFGQAWNTGGNYGDHLSAGRWFRRHGAPRALVTTIEFPYAEVLGSPVMPGDPQAFGRDLAAAIRAWLEGR